MVTAYNTRTRVFQDIPEHWIGHPIWGADWTLTPPPRPANPCAAARRTPPTPPTVGTTPPTPSPKESKHAWC